MSCRTVSIYIYNINIKFVDSEIDLGGYQLDINMSQNRNIKAKLTVKFSNSAPQELTVPTREGDDDYNIYSNINEALERELNSRTLDQVNNPDDIIYVTNQLTKYIDDGNSIMTRFGEIRELNVVDIDP